MGAVAVRQKNPIVLVGLSLALLTGARGPVPGLAGAAPSPYTFTFAGSPPAPLPWNPTTWDLQIHKRGIGSDMEPTLAQHGADCAPTPAMHPIHTLAEAVFICRNHLMTAINDRGYGVIYLTPDNMVDFSGDGAVIGFNLSTLRTSQRDWIDLWVSPFAENLATPFQDQNPDLQGPPRDAIHIKMDQNNGQTIFRGEIYRGFRGSGLDHSWQGLESVVASSGVTRTRFALYLTRTHVRFGLPESHVWWIDADVAALDWTRGVVQLGHHSYFPTKADGCGPPIDVRTCSGDTWHWSNFSISSAVPFTILPGDPRWVSPSAPGPVSFPAPAPPNAFLRFSGIGPQCCTYDVSFDRGVSWRPAQRQDQLGTADEHFTTYWMPVPARTQSVQLRGRNWWGGPWWVRDVSIWGDTPPGPAAALPGLPPDPAVPVWSPGQPAPGRPAPTAAAQRLARAVRFVARQPAMAIAAIVLLNISVIGAAGFLGRRRRR